MLRSAAVLAAVLALAAGCSMTPTQKKVAAIAASVVITGVIISRDDGNRPMGTTIRTPGTDCESDPQSCL